MKHAEFEEKAYEAPLYNQLERGVQDVFTPGQVLEATVGFDRGIYVADIAVWHVLGYATPPPGAALAYYAWPTGWGPPSPRKALPRFRLNLFLQAKRSRHHTRRPRTLKSVSSHPGPLWSFAIDQQQHLLLEAMEAKVGRRAHVCYAAPAFQTYTELFRHTKHRSMADNSTFPTVAALAGHEAWFYWQSGADGVANPNPERIEEVTLFERIRGIEPSPEALDGGLGWLNGLADALTAAAIAAPDEARTAQFMEDALTLDRLLEPFELGSPLRSYARALLFVRRFELSWLVLS